jgi:hypothetical protein
VPVRGGRSFGSACVRVRRVVHCEYFGHRHRPHGPVGAGPESISRFRTAPSIPILVGFDGNLWSDWKANKFAGSRPPASSRTSRSRRHAAVSRTSRSGSMARCPSASSRPAGIGVISTAGMISDFRTPPLLPPAAPHRGAGRHDDSGSASTSTRKLGKIRLWRSADRPGRSDLGRIPTESPRR